MDGALSVENAPADCLVKTSFSALNVSRKMGGGTCAAPGCVKLEALDTCARALDEAWAANVAAFVGGGWLGPAGPTPPKLLSNSSPSSPSAAPPPKMGRVAMEKEVAGVLVRGGAAPEEESEPGARVELGCGGLAGEGEAVKVPRGAHKSPASKCPATRVSLSACTIHCRSGWRFVTTARAHRLLHTAHHASRNAGRTRRSDNAFPLQLYPPRPALLRTFWRSHIVVGLHLFPARATAASSLHGSPRPGGLTPRREDGRPGGFILCATLLWTCSKLHHVV